jgi:hypothetical protein
MKASVFNVVVHIGEWCADSRHMSLVHVTL